MVIHGPCVIPCTRGKHVSLKRLSRTNISAGLKTYLLQSYLSAGLKKYKSQLLMIHTNNIWENQWISKEQEIKPGIFSATFFFAVLLPPVFDSLLSSTRLSRSMTALSQASSICNINIY